MDENQEAIEALIESDSYVNKKAAESMAQSLFQDFQMLMQLEIFKLVLSRFEDPEDAKKCLENIKKIWEDRSATFLKSEAKRFQDLILKSSISPDNRKLPNEVHTIFSDYSRTLTTAFGQASEAVNNTINALINENSKKEN